jgi:hypothetical protein
LGTREPNEAKRLHALKLAEVEERRANLRRGQQPLSSDDIAREAALIGDQVRRGLEADQYQPVNWDTEVGASLWMPLVGSDLYTDVSQALPAQHRRKLDQQHTCYILVDDHLAARGLTLEALDRERLARAVSLEMQRVSQGHQAFLLGKTNEHVVPAVRNSNGSAAPITFESVIEGWLLEKKPIKKTEYVWRKVLKQLSDFVGHDDVRRLRAEDLVAWKADLLAKGLKAKTIRDGKLAPVRAVLQWAADNRKLEINPGARINIDLKVRSSEKRRGYRIYRNLRIGGDARTAFRTEFVADELGECL